MIIARRGIEFLIDIVGEILAFVTIFLIALMYINGKFRFLPEDITATLTYVREVAIIAVISLKGLEFSLKRSFILTGIFLVVVIVIITFMFFPESLPSWAQLFSGKLL